jgi:hypothetical protein
MYIKTKSGDKTVSPSKESFSPSQKNFSFADSSTPSNGKWFGLNYYYWLLIVAIIIMLIVLYFKFK